MGPGQERSHLAPQRFKLRSLIIGRNCAAKKSGTRQHDFCIDIWFLIITSKMRCSFSAALGRGYMLPESPLESGEELVGRETLISLWDLYEAKQRAAAGALALTKGREAIPASLQTRGQCPLPPARKNSVADGARAGSSRRVERRLGCHILEAFTGTCHRSPVGGDGLG